MSDGCTWALDWLPFVGDMTPHCIEHDRACHYGGGREEFEVANRKLEADIRSLDGWAAGICATIRYQFVSSWLGWRLFNQLGPGLPENSPQGARYSGAEHPLG